MRTRVASHGGSVLPVSDHLPGQPTSLPEVPLVRSWQKYVAEFLGTLILVFVGSVAILSTQVGGDARILGIAFGFGIALLAGLYAFGEVSGGHFNPIVSLGMFLDRRLSALDTIWYWIAQFLGAIAASLLILVLWADRDAVKATATTSASDARGFFLELIFSALFAIPLTLFAIHVALIPFTGSSVNPARTFGPDLVGATGWSDIWIYLLAPPAGAIIGWAVHMVTVRGDTSLRDDLSRAAGDMRKVEFDDIRQGPGQVPPPPSPDEPQKPQGPGQV
jgi:aquaporin Z